MSFRNRGGGGFRGRGGGGGGGFRGGKGFNRQDVGPPEQVVPLGHLSHTSQDDLVVKSEIEDVPFFNAPIYLENKKQIGKIDEIFGNLKDYYVSVCLSDEVKSKSFKTNDKFYIDPAKLLPLKRFLPKPPGGDKIPKGIRGAGRGGRGRGQGGFGGRGGGGRGGDRRGGFRGGEGRGSFGGRGGGGNRNSFGGRGGRGGWRR